MTFISLLERVSRKLISLKNKVLRQESEKIQLLGDLMHSSSRSYVGAQDWAQNCAVLIESNLLDRISKRDIALILAGLVSCRDSEPATCVEICCGQSNVSVHRYVR